MTTMEPPDDESVHEAIARETARRKRVLLAFLALALVPIAIGAYALSKAPTETSKIATDVTPIVSERVERTISESVTNNVVTRSQPLIRQNVSSAVASAERVLRQDYASLQATVQQTSAATAAQIAVLPELQTRVAGLDESAGRTAAQFENLKTLHDQLRADVTGQRELAERLSRDVARIGATVDGVNRDIDGVRGLADRSARIASANQEAMGSITRRLSQLDKELDALNRRLAAIEDRLKIE